MTNSKSRTTSPFTAMMAHFQLGRFAQRDAGDRTTPARPDLAVLARTAGDRGTSARPMSNARRAANYTRQRNTTGAHPCYQLTPAQSKRLRKRRNAMDSVETRLTV